MKCRVHHTPPLCRHVMAARCTGSLQHNKLSHRSPGQLVKSARTPKDTVPPVLGHLSIFVSPLGNTRVPNMQPMHSQRTSTKANNESVGETMPAEVSLSKSELYAIHTPDHPHGACTISQTSKPGLIVQEAECPLPPTFSATAAMASLMSLREILAWASAT